MEMDPSFASLLSLPEELVLKDKVSRYTHY
jgi:hypothetical protein